MLPIEIITSEASDSLIIKIHRGYFINTNLDEILEFVDEKVAPLLDEKE
jgi:hypothetical protein